MDSEPTVRNRAYRETGIILAMALLPLLLGAFLTGVHEQHDHVVPRHGWMLAYRAVLGGQCFLLFLSLAGTILARLWDPDGPKFQFSSLLNIFHFCGGVIAGGLLAIDPTSATFDLWPVGILSLLFFLAAILNYFIMALASYITKPDLQETSYERGKAVGSSLEARMG